MIGLNMRLENCHDRRISLTRDLKIVLDMLEVWINNGQFAFAGATKHVRGAPCLRMKDLPKDHAVVSVYLNKLDKLNFPEALADYLSRKKLADSQPLNICRMSS